MLFAWIEYGPTGIPMLHITRNRHPLPGSEGDPRKILWYTLWFIWVIGACQIAFAMAVIFKGRADGGFYLIGAAGFVLTLLGFLAWGRSVVVMVLASLLAFGELALLIISEDNINAANVVRLIFGLGLFGWLLKRGIVAVNDLKKNALPVRHPPERLHQLNSLRALFLHTSE